MNMLDNTTTDGGGVVKNPKAYDLADGDDKKDDKDNAIGPLSSSSQVFTAFGRSRKVVLFRWLGVICSIVSGSTYPLMAFYFSKSFERLGAQTGSEDFLDDITELAFIFLVLGAVGFVFLVAQSTFLEIASSESAADYKIQWFNALLRMDMAYYDIKDVSSQATVVAASAAKYKKGTGRKLGEGIQFFVTVIGGFIFAFYVSWRISLLILAAVPLMVGSATFMMVVTTKQTERKNKNYAETGGIVYSTISAIRTVFSLNAAELMIEKFQKSTQKVYDSSISFTYLVGFGNGAMMASFLASYIVLTLYGSYQLYKEVDETGCDPSNTLSGDYYNEPCKVIGYEVFGALMGISFGAMGLAQISNAIEAFTGARAACHPALEAINRTLDSDQFRGHDEEAAISAEKRSDITLPKYAIDASSDEGKKPSYVDGRIVFNNVSFAYPTRPESLVFDGFSLNIEPGKTVALVGPSGGGKSTTISMLERFYDPTAGSITLDGTDIREINVRWLRDQIGLVSQEPVLFARTIKENIGYGMTGATEEQIISVAKSANAHDFIMQFPNGYETQVGDKGAQLSGGQKQRIAIARILLKNPKILLLDEATSALDSESEYVVQEALDSLLGKGNRTTIVVAHRLSTIRHADMIAVVKDGRIVETGTHDELVGRDGSEYGKLVSAQAPKSSYNSSSALSKLVDVSEIEGMEVTGIPQIAFRGVHFNYPSRPNVKIFQGLDLHVRQGETLAIVGPSGGGKSTVVQMIERFYDPHEGVVEYEGTDLTEINIKWYRDQIGFVSQEPTLFNTTIGENIKYGYPGASQAEIEEAAKQANAHNFIMNFPNGYNTEVGENATQISGGQKQRIAIARAILKKPKILMLDEATSALDSESERVVQAAIDSLMQSKNQTIIVIAHRLSTIQDADRIAVIADGMLKEIGSHSELMKRPDGRYRRLVEFQSMTGSEKKGTMKKATDDDEEDKIFDVSEHDLDVSKEDKEKEKVQSSRAKMLAKEDYGLFFIGSIGAILAGIIFPGWGVVFAYMIELLFRPVFKCDESKIDSEIMFKEYFTCQEYWDHESKWIENMSYYVTFGWAGLVASTLIGNILLFYGFGTATERMNKRVRDTIFISLMKQDIAFYDTHSVAKLSSQLEDDAAMIHSFSGEPIRTLIMTMASVLLGVILSFYYMWPFALLTLAILPFMGFGAHMEMKTYMGEDEGAEAPKEGEDSAGAIVVETLLSIRTVASLAIEKMRVVEYVNALQREDPASVKTNLIKGLATGAGFFIQMWGMALMFWWGAWVLVKYPNNFTYRDFLISMFALLFSLSGMSVAVMGATDKAKAKIAADRIFSLIDRESPMNALSDEGKKNL